MILIGGNAMAKAWTALPAADGITIDNPLCETLEVYDLDANLVATIKATVSIELPAGTYLVTSATRSRKVIVK
jgi:hypothetical protein